MFLMSGQKKAAEKKESESTQDRIVQVDDLLTFRQFSKKSADDPIDVRFLSCVSLFRHLCFVVVRRGPREGNGHC
jgi:hypothetical protein